MWRLIVLVWTDVSEERIASIFRVEKSASVEPAWADSVSSHQLRLVRGSWICLRWRWRRYVPPKRLFTQELHAATSQKTAFFFAYYHVHKTLSFDSILSQLDPIAKIAFFSLTGKYPGHAYTLCLLFLGSYYINSEYFFQLLFPRIPTLASNTHTHSVSRFDRYSLATPPLVQQFWGPW
jgi:hypothetical protein